MRKLILLLVFVVFVCLNTTGQAVTPAGMDLTSVDQTSFVPSGALHISNPVSGVQISSSKGETSASINFGFELSNKLSGNIAISSPTASSGRTRPLGLDGLASDGKVTIGIQFKEWSAIPAAPIIAALGPYGVNSFLDLTSADKQQVATNLRAAGTLTSPWFLGGTLTVNKQNFEYATDNTLATIMDETNNSVSWSVYGGVYVGRFLNSLFRGVVLGKRSFNANSANDYFQPFNGGPTLIRKNLIIGAPTEESEVEVRLENVTAFASWGINPSVTYLTEAEKFSIDLPVYLLSGKDGNNDVWLNAGVYLNYIVDVDEPLNAGIFIGSSLNSILGAN